METSPESIHLKDQRTTLEGNSLFGKNSCSPPRTITFRGLFFSKGAVVSFGAFWFKYKPRLFTYSNQLKPRINRSISILRLTSLQSLTKFLTKSLCVSISICSFSKSGLSTETEAGWNCLVLVFVVPLHLLLVLVADPTPSQATPPKSTWSAKTAAFTSVSGECITLTWWYPHLMDGSKKKSSGNICFKGKFAHLLLQFSFQLRRLLYQQTGNVERTHIFQEAANVCCQCFESPPPFHWATLTVKTKPLASAPARPKSACSWSSDRPYLVDPSKHCRVWLERFRGEG